MANKALILLELRKLWGVNALLHGSGRTGYRITVTAAPPVLSALLAGYLGCVCYGLLQLGMEAGQVQTLLLAAVSAMLLMIGMFRTGPQLFSGSHSEMLLAMPVLPKQILSARWLRLYLEDLLLAALPVPAAVAVLGAAAPMPAGFWGLPLLSVPVLPLMPLAVSGLCSILTERVTAGKRHRVLLSALLTAAEFVLLGAVLKLVPPAPMELGDYVLYGIVSIVLTCVLSGAAAGAWPAILSGRTPAAAHRQADVAGLRSEALHRALVRREWKQYWSHGTYVTNTILGPILAAAVSAGLLVTDLTALGLPARLEPLVPVLPAVLLSMMNPTACSVSIEGKHWWILRTMPLRTRDVVRAKLWAGAALPLVSAGLSGVLLVLRSHTSAAGILTSLMLPASAVLFSAVWGLSVNFRFPNFHWEDEVEVVKQGISPVLGGFVPSLLVLACGAPVALFPDWGGPAVSGGAADAQCPSAAQARTAASPR